jgi:hypothetical protein
MQSTAPLSTPSAAGTGSWQPQGPSHAQPQADAQPQSLPYSPPPPPQDGVAQQHQPPTQAGAWQQQPPQDSSAGQQPATAAYDEPPQAAQQPHLDAGYGQPLDQPAVGALGADGMPPSSGMSHFPSDEDVDPSAWSMPSKRARALAFTQLAAAPRAHLPDARAVRNCSAASLSHPLPCPSPPSPPLTPTPAPAACCVCSARLGCCARTATEGARSSCRRSRSTECDATTARPQGGQAASRPKAGARRARVCTRARS